jgi:4-hydroxybenzoate polyprenyltransferase
MSVIKDLFIGTDHIYNLNETRLQEGITIGGIVGGTVLTTSSDKMQSDASSWITILESICTDGRRLTPTVIYTGTTS